MSCLTDFLLYTKATTNKPSSPYAQKMNIIEPVQLSSHHMVLKIHSFTHTVNIINTVFATASVAQVTESQYTPDRNSLSEGLWFNPQSAGRFCVRIPGGACFLPVRRYASAVFAVERCLPVCLSHAAIVSN